MNLLLGLKLGAGAAVSSVRSYLAGALQQFHTRASGAWAVDTGAGTNLIPVSDPRTGAAVGLLGAGGQLTTGWSCNSKASSGLDTEVVGFGVDAGVPYIDLHVFGTTLTTFWTVAFDSTTGVVIQPGQQHTVSAFLSRLSGDFAGVTACYLRQWDRDSGGASVASGNNDVVTLYMPTSGPMQRFSVAAVSKPTAAYSRHSWEIGCPVGTAIDFTVRIGNPQFNYGGTPDPLAATTGTPVTKLKQYAANVLRVVTSPAGYTAALVEPQSTNACANNTMVGANVGSNTLPTGGWSRTQGAGFPTWNVVGLGTEDGIPYIDMQLVGTNTSGGTAYMAVTMASVVAGVAPGQTWTASAFIRQIAGSTAGLIWGATEGLRIAESGGSPVYSGVDVRGVGNGSLATSRLSKTLTLSDPGTTSIRMDMQFPVNNGVSVDCTFRVGLPQLEQLDYASSPILTSSGTATRAGDNVAMSFTPGAQGTLFASYELPLSVATTRHEILCVSDAGVNRLAIRAADAAGFAYPVAVVGDGTSNANVSPADISVLSGNKVALSFDQTGTSLSRNGAAPTTVAKVWVPPAGNLVLGIGCDNVGNLQLGGYIREARVYTQALSAAALQAATA